MFVYAGSLRVAVVSNKNRPSLAGMVAIVRHRYVVQFSRVSIAPHVLMVDAGDFNAATTPAVRAILHGALGLEEVELQMEYIKSID